MKATPLRQRFWDKVSLPFDATDEDCWEWNAATSRGFGRILVGRDNLKAHRVSWELHKGSIPNGLNVLHRCDNCRCINPSHLFLGTHDDNNKDMMAKGRTHNGQKTHCAYGHPLSGDNLKLFTDSKGQTRRMCIACSKEYYWRNK